MEAPKSASRVSCFAKDFPSNTVEASLKKREREGERKKKRKTDRKHNRKHLPVSVCLPGSRVSVPRRPPNTEAAITEQLPTFTRSDTLTPTSWLRRLSDSTNWWSNRENSSVSSCVPKKTRALIWKMPTPTSQWVDWECTSGKDGSNFSLCLAATQKVSVEYFFFLVFVLCLNHMCDGYLSPSLGPIHTGRGAPRNTRANLLTRAMCTGPYKWETNVCWTSKRWWKLFWKVWTYSARAVLPKQSDTNVEVEDVSAAEASLAVSVAYHVHPGLLQHVRGVSCNQRIIMLTASKALFVEHFLWLKTRSHTKSVDFLPAKICGISRILSETFIFPEMPSAPKSQKSPTIPTSKAIKQPQLCSLENTQPQKRHGRKRKIPLMSSCNYPYGQCKVGVSQTKIAFEMKQMSFFSVWKGSRFASCKCDLLCRQIQKPKTREIHAQEGWPSKPKIIFLESCCFR